MNSPIPRCFKGSVQESLAYEQGQEAARAGLAREVNPHEEGVQEGSCEVTNLAAYWNAGWRSLQRRERK